MPILAAGADLDQINRGALKGFQTAFLVNNDNPVLNYVTSRNLCYRDDKFTDIKVMGKEECVEQTKKILGIKE